MFEPSADTIDYTLPTMPFSAGAPDVGTIYDKMGLPTDVAQAFKITAVQLSTNDSKDYKTT